MTSTTHAHPYDSIANDGITAETLQTCLVNLLTVGLLAKQAHWNVVGPNFRSIHLQLDEVADYARAAADDVAERIATVGAHPDGRPSTISASNTMPTIELGTIREASAAKSMLAALDVAIEQLRTAVDMTADADPVSQGLLIDITAALEKHAWLLRAQI